MIGMIVYSFAWRKYVASLCNRRLAAAASRIAGAQEGDVFLFAQRTTARALGLIGIDCHVMPKGAGYEGSEQVTNQAAPIFRQLGITEVIPVAQPVFQLRKCIWLVQRSGFRTWSHGRLVAEIGPIGFDPLSVQPATRSRAHLMFYTARQILTGYRPPVEQSEP